MQISDGLMEQSKQELTGVNGNVRQPSLSTHIVEFRTNQQVEDVYPVAVSEQQECWPELEVEPAYFVRNLIGLLNDVERVEFNAWLVYSGDRCIGFCYGRMFPLLHVRRSIAVLQMIYILPEFRGSYAMVKMVKRFEQWARDNGAIRMTLGVERIDDKKAAMKIKNVFPRLGYKWSGSFYTKEVQ